MPRFPFSFRRIATFAGVFVLFLLVVEFNTRLEELNRLNEQRDETRTKATQAAQTKIALQTEVGYAQSTAAVEEWARSEGHYIREGDQPVIPIGKPGSAPVVVATPTPMPTPLPNWEVWWNLFFDK
jgi:cell division protein FtsB